MDLFDRLQATTPRHTRRLLEYAGYFERGTIGSARCPRSLELLPWRSRIRL